MDLRMVACMSGGGIWVVTGRDVTEEFVSAGHFCRRFKKSFRSGESLSRGTYHELDSQDEIYEFFTPKKAKPEIQSSFARIHWIEMQGEE